MHESVGKAPPSDCPFRDHSSQLRLANELKIGFDKHSWARVKRGKASTAVLPLGNANIAATCKEIASGDM